MLICVLRVVFVGLVFVLLLLVAFVFEFAVDDVGVVRMYNSRIITKHIRRRRRIAIALLINDSVSIIVSSLCLCMIRHSVRITIRILLTPRIRVNVCVCIRTMFNDPVCASIQHVCDHIMCVHGFMIVSGIHGITNSRIWCSIRTSLSVRILIRITSDIMFVILLVLSLL